MNVSFIHQPKKIIPAALIIAMVIGFFIYRSIGKPPAVNVPNDATSTDSGVTVNSISDSVDLAFPQGGRVGSVAIAVGDTVTKDEVLASLDAGSAAGAVTQAKGALELAEAQYASLDVTYANAKNQQDVLVENAYRTLLSSGLAAIPSVQDDSHIPTISGTYTCDKEGSYTVTPYQSGATSGYSFNYSGLESGNGPVTFNTPQPLGSCGLYIQFAQGFSGATNWTISIPSTESANYIANENAYNLAVTTRDQVLSQYAANLGADGSSSANTAEAAVDAAEGVYQSALGNYQNYLIVSPADGTVSFIDTDLKVGQVVTPNEAVISITTH